MGDANKFPKKTTKPVGTKKTEGKQAVEAKVSGSHAMKEKEKKKDEKAETRTSEPQVEKDQQKKKK
ncbi:hypothetical protein A2U01_0062302, partial [Trifolium medium]|nr:hypothetical protein [Trifolium medium]